jgi:hypothetical protein
MKFHPIGKMPDRQDLQMTLCEYERLSWPLVLSYGWLNHFSA